MTKQYKVTQEDFDRVNSDSNGNPRYAIHFTLCTPDSYKDEGSIVGVYPSVCKLMNTIGGRKYHNKSYGGGIVFQSYNLNETAKAINELIKQENKGV